jgi:hypothetical protein
MARPALLVSWDGTALPERPGEAELIHPGGTDKVAGPDYAGAGRWTGIGVPWEHRGPSAEAAEHERCNENPALSPDRRLG